MDVNYFRIAVMLAGFALFIALMLHTYSRSRRQEHEEAALLPFRSDAAPDAQGAPEGTGRAGQQTAGEKQ